MTATIAYDKPVKNLIDQLSATGHVTHTAYKKKSVTIHHNGGRLSHEGVLSVWKTRPASAHFDVDSSGAVAQYVKVNEYAWAVGNTTGNQQTISIEQANATLAPGWTVADATWQNAARLAGWLFAKVVDGTPRPTKDNLFYHHHWSSTDCAGPYMEGIYAKVLSAAQAAYDSFKKKPSAPSSPDPSTPGKMTIAEVAKKVIAGDYGNDPGRSQKLKADGFDPSAVQNEVNRQLNASSKPPAKPGSPSKESLTDVAHDVIAGKYGNGPERTRKLLAAHYDPNAVRDEVNKLLNPIPRGRKSVQQVAAEVVAGKWGNGESRIKDLEEAGYNPAAIQREVNLLVKKKR